MFTRIFFIMLIFPVADNPPLALTLSQSDSLMHGFKVGTRFCRATAGSLDPLPNRGIYCHKKPIPHRWISLANPRLKSHLCLQLQQSSVVHRDANSKPPRDTAESVQLERDDSSFLEPLSGAFETIPVAMAHACRHRRKHTQPHNQTNTRAHTHDFSCRGNCRTPPPSPLVHRRTFGDPPLQ